MKSYFLAAIVSSILFVQLGCSGGPTGAGSNSDVRNANSGDVAAPSSFTTAAEALAEGNRLFDDGETVKAIDVLLEAVKLDPDLAEAYFKLGVAYDLVEAQDDTVSETAEMPDPKSKKPKEVKKNSEIAFENAVKAYKKILSVNKDDDVAHFNLGLAYNKLNEDEEAARSLREAAELKPDDTQYHTELGSILIKLAKYHEAVTALKKAIELDPTNVKAEELLERADAGRKRIDFTPPKKDDKKDSNSNTNSGKEAEDPESDIPEKPDKPANKKPAKSPVPARSPK